MGVILIIWGLGALRTNFAFSVSPQEGSKLVTTGPYRWMRHPLYTAFLIEAAGISVVMASWFVGLMAALVWGLLVYRTRIEEEKLIERYGNQYRLYMESAGRFFPRLTR
jgi:protein-S-isoprenylcysteine O-methyltransferase Ste14